jgi:hypothetical protein
MLAIICITSCRKEPGFRIDLPPSLYTADVIDKWMTLELRIYKNATGITMARFPGPLLIQVLVLMNPLIPDFSPGSTNTMDFPACRNRSF